MATGRLFEHLAKHFPRDSIFMDVDALVPGAKFVDVLKRSVAQCDTFIAMIGPNWSTNSDGVELFENPNDFVRIEVTAALERDIRTIPVLLEGMTMPRPEDLPADMRSLVHRHAITLRHTRFNADADLIVSAIEAEKRPLLSRQALVAASIGVLSIGALLGWFYVDGWKHSEIEAASPKHTAAAPATDPLVDIGGAPTSSSPADTSAVPAKASPTDDSTVPVTASPDSGTAPVTALPADTGTLPAGIPAADSSKDLTARSSIETGILSTLDLPKDPDDSPTAPPLDEVSKDSILLARFIFSEARHEDIDTWQAVANVVLNRVKHEKYPSDVSEVMFQKQQFSFSNKKNRDYALVQSMIPGSSELFDEMLEFSQKILSGEITDNTEGAVSYHLGRRAPRWSRRMMFTKQIGPYKFYKHQ